MILSLVELLQVDLPEQVLTFQKAVRKTVQEAVYSQTPKSSPFHHLHDDFSLVDVSAHYSPITKADPE